MPVLAAANAATKKTVRLALENDRFTQAAREVGGIHACKHRPTHVECDGCRTERRAAIIKREAVAFAKEKVREWLTASTQRHHHSDQTGENYRYVCIGRTWEREEPSDEELASLYTQLVAEIVGEP